MSAGMKNLVKRAQSDRSFLYELLNDPRQAAGDFDLDDNELQALAGGNTVAFWGLWPTQTFLPPVVVVLAHVRQRAPRRAP